MSDSSNNTDNMSTSCTYPALTKEIVAEILESAAPYSSDEERETCQRLVEALTPEEQLSAACTSYAFWYDRTVLKKDNENDSDDSCRRLRMMAMREARRHLVGADHDEAAALDRFRFSCNFRKENHIDLLRTCYPIQDPDNNGQYCQVVVEGTPEEEKIRAEFRSQIEEELHSKQLFFVRGMDRESRAVAVKMGRQSPTTIHEAYVTTQFYVAERAIACTEYKSRGIEEKIILVADFENYSSSNAPPLLTLKESISLLQSIYPERLKTAVITEPAFWMRALYNVLYALMSTDTREKIQMAYGEGKHETMSALVAPEQAMKFMMPEGQLESPLEVDKFLKQVPFYCLYDSNC